MPQSEMVTARTSWRLGPLSLFSWAALVFALMAAAYSASRLGEAFPLYDNEEYMAGAFPMLWLAYVCVPLIVRDVYLNAKGLLTHKTEFFVTLGLLVLGGLAVYRYVFGWLY